MNFEVIMLNKISQLQSDKHCVILFICGALEVVKIIETVEWYLPGAQGGDIMFNSYSILVWQVERSPGDGW